LSLEPGTRVGVYEVIALVGAGGMGQVYRARDTKLHRDVALKVLPDSVAADAERLERFNREARILAALDHPNIAHIHGLEEFQGVTALVMEFVDGDDLSQRLEHGPFPSMTRCRSPSRSWRRSKPRTSGASCTAI
jgi:serine/threonine protein kinase